MDETRNKLLDMQNKIYEYDRLIKRNLFEEEQIRASAELVSRNLIMYGVDIRDKLDTAVQTSYALEQAYLRGRHDERNRYWTSVEEGLPSKELQLYWTTHEDGSVILHSYTEANGFIYNWEVDDLAKRERQGKVIAWMPIFEPEPYKE